MSNEELAQAIKTGERDKLLTLWEQVRRFAYQQARRWAAAGRGGITVEDLVQEGFLAMLDALERWRPEAGTFLSMYSMRLKAAFTLAIGQRTQRDRLDPLQYCLSLETPLTDDDTDLFTLADVLPDPRAAAAVTAIEERELATRRRKAVQEALDTLPADQRQAVILRYWQGVPTDTRTLHAGLRALRHPNVSRQLREFLP